MSNVLLVGAGQIGSRHLQGLSKSKLVTQIDVVDPSQESLVIAQERWEQVKRNDKDISVRYLGDLSEVNAEYDTVLIATCSKYRLGVLVELATKVSFKNLILEKFLFPKLSDYLEAEKLIQEKGIRAWVNCPNRMMPIYKRIKNLNKSGGRLFYSVQGGSFGMACNAIHYLDLISYLTGDDSLELSGALLEKGEAASKRENYVEYYGSLVGSSKNGSQIILSSMKQDDLSVVHSITGEAFQANLDEIHGFIRFNDGSGWKEEQIGLSYQSELTGIAVDEICMKGSCDLPLFAESSQLHQKILTVFLKHSFGEDFNEETVCAIT